MTRVGNAGHPEPLVLARNTLTACPICKAPFASSSRTVSAKDPFGVSSEAFTLMECGTCLTYVLNPRPSMEQMGVFYESDFLLGTEVRGKSFIDRLAARQQELNLTSEIRWIQRHLPTNSNYLDYSAGNGQIVEIVSRKRRDACVFATEFSSQYRHWIRRRIGDASLRASIDEFPTDLRFDLISAFGVLEHVEDPRTLLRKLRQRLKTRGKLVLSVPNIDSLQRSIAGKRWYSWLAPRHWHLMNMRTLKRLLMEEGFEIEEEKHFFLRTSSSTFALSLFPSLDPLLPQKPWTLIAYAVLFYLLIPIELVAASVAKAGFMGVVARRK